MVFRERVLGPVWHGGGPLVLWALYLFGLYILVAAGCLAGWDQAPFAGTSLLRVVLLLCGAMAVSTGAARVWHDCAGVRRRSPGLLAAASRLSAWLALIGVLWVTLPLLLLPLPCTPG